MADPPPAPGSNDDTGVGPTRGSATGASRRMKAFGTIVLVKLFGIVFILVLLRELQIQFGIGVTMLVLLHVAAATALVVYSLRGRIRHRWRR